MVNTEKIKSEKSIQELLEFGILNIDKPSGPTSFNVSDFARKRLNNAGIKAGKTSHFGTLDPKVTGVLPIALNRACKLTGFFLGEDKEYVGIMRFHEEISLEAIEKAIRKPSSKPKVIICDTIKGKGVSFMEDSLVFHYKYVDDETYEKALKELK